jgi:hypothetical protein
MRELVIQGAAEGLGTGAQAMQQDAQTTALYQGVTGATRAGTVAYVAGVEGSDGFEEAVANVRELNPDHVLAQTVEALGPDELAVVLTVPTDYIADLITKNAGAQDFLGPTLTAHATRLTAAAARGIVGKLR